MTNTHQQLEFLRQLLREGRISQVEFDQQAPGASAHAADSSAIAQGEGAHAQAARSVSVGGDNHGPINTGVQLTQIIEAAQAPGASETALRHAYLARLITQCNQLPLLAGEPGGDKFRLSSVYTALLTQHSATQRLADLASGHGGDEAKHLSALDVLNAEPRLVLMGGPGSGKSSFANVLALALANQALADAGVACGDFRIAQLAAPIPRKRDGKEPQPQVWTHGALLPVRVVLRDLASNLPAPGEAINADTIWQFVIAQLHQATLGDYAPHLHAHLLQHGGLILLDGLDEVPDAHRHREQIKRAVQAFAASFHRCRFLVTSRTYAYQRQDWKLDGFAEAQLLPFLPWQIDAFVDGWYAQTVALQQLSAAEAGQRAARLKHEAAHNPRIGELAQWPLLLTLIAQLQTKGGGVLPERREELYEKAVDMLLETWERMKPRPQADGGAEPSLAEFLKVGRERIRSVLNRLAFEAHRDQPELTGSADIASDTLIAALLQAAQDPDAKPQRLEEYLRDRAGILAAHGNGVYQFPHRSFQEYLAACYLTDDPNFPDTLAHLARADPNRWREVVALAGAKAARGAKTSAWLLAETLCPTPLAGDPQNSDLPLDEADAWGGLLAGRVLVESADLDTVSARDRSKHERIRDWQLAILRRPALPSVERALAGRSLAALGDPRPEVMTLDGMQFCHVPAGRFWMGSENGHDDEKPMHQVELPDYWIARYPVSVAQWREYLSAEQREAEDADSIAGRGNDPVHWVSWYEALHFCHALTRRWAAHLPAGWQVMLPSEAEWEKASRGGEQVPATPRIATVDALHCEAAVALHANPLPQREYPWGDEPTDECANMHQSIGQTSALGAYPRGCGPYGGEDLSGNVWEWTRSVWGREWGKPAIGYPYRPDDPTREALDAGDDWLRVVRGGSWNLPRLDARCALRLRNFPGSRLYNLGFRVVLRSAPVQ